jgi:hypothetical protein
VESSGYTLADARALAGARAGDAAHALSGRVLTDLQTSWDIKRRPSADAQRSR